MEVIEIFTNFFPIADTGFYLRYNLQQQAADKLQILLDAYIRAFRENQLNSGKEQFFSYASHQKHYTQILKEYRQKFGPRFSIRREDFLQTAEEERKALLLEFLLALEQEGQTKIIDIFARPKDSTDFEQGYDEMFTLQMKTKKIVKKKIRPLKGQRKKVYEEAIIHKMDFLDLWNLIWKDSVKMDIQKRNRIQKHIDATFEINGRSFVNRYLQKELANNTYRQWKKKCKETHPQEWQKIAENMP